MARMTQKATYENLETLRELKLEIKEMEDEAKELSKTILNSKYAPTQYKLKNGGYMRRVKQQNFEMNDAIGVMELVGTDFFMDNVTLAASKIKKEVGGIGFEELLDDEFVVEIEPSIYYKFFKTPMKE